MKVLSMKTKPVLKSWSSLQALAILSVDNIVVSDFAKDVLKRREDGLLTFEEARQEILVRATMKPAPEVIQEKSQ
jgi:hypothetical protein